MADQKELNQKAQAIDSAIAQIEKQFGKGSIMKLGDQSAKVKVDAISTGSLELDIALGIGGIPKGRIIEIYGPESSGKTTLTLHIVAECQKTGGMAAFIDAEHALDPVYALKLGVKTDDLLVSQPDTGEEALEICESLVRSGAVDIIVIDSVAALVPKAEIDGDMGDSHMGLQARLMSQALRKLTGIIAKTNCTVIFINQIRHKIGVMFGSPETTTGGNALKFYASVRLDIRKIETLKVGEDSIGNRVRVKVVKNKVAPPFKKAEFDMMFNEGISKTGGLVDLGTEFNILKKSGTWYSYGEDKIGQGRENVKKYLAENPSILAEVERKVRAAAGLVEDEPAVSKKEKVKEIKEVKEVKVSKEPPEVKAVPEEEAEYIPDNE
ncbi:MAG TPA: recombinase RecA [Spirochaetota bacterium]|jgi:recombination protein RecA|nr:recombinase RecA [Spirochaetota bacterium]HOH37161.1 recombinase RecA [Spirochaetota bacterium]HPJ14030.1 recombinase RecA [Spirochaetota bacterium]HPM34728.1 recombinase RecA [Spirochaetota bacterium]HPW52469.1 recombinase RecA [Spirochaetota bacterium]